MCEGRFLVRTRVTDNVIRQVTVENFRFGVRVIKKSEGYWSCQDLNQSPEKLQKNCQENVVVVRNNFKNDNNLKKKDSSSLQCSKNSKLSSLSSLTCKSQQSKRRIIGNSTLSTLENNNYNNRQRQIFHKQVNAPTVVNLSSLNNNKNSKVKNPQHTSKTTITSDLLKSQLQKGDYYSSRNVLAEPRKTEVLLSGKGIKSTPVVGTGEHLLKYPVTLGLNNKDRISTKTQEFNSQYLSKYLGKSPLLKLQLLNLIVVPVDGQQRCPELIPMETISSLQSMLFDDDVSGSVHEKIRPRGDIDDDRLDSKRVKMEIEDEDLVIDENAVDEHDIISEESNSIENNLEGVSVIELLDNSTDVQDDMVPTTTATTETEATISSAANNDTSDNEGPASFENRSNSNSPVGERRSSITVLTKNGHSGKLLTKTNQQNRKLSNSDFQTYEDSDNTKSKNRNEKSDTTSDSAAGKVLRLEKQIMSLTTLLKSKEREWNAIIRLKKLKELALDIFRRQQEVEELNNKSQPNSEDLSALLATINSETELTGAGEAQTRLSAESTEKEIKEEEKKLKCYKIQDDEFITAATTSSIKKDTPKDSTKQNNNDSLNSLENFKASLALQQLCERKTTSLLQTSGGSSTATVVQNNHNSSGGIQSKVLGEGRQGTIVEVRSIIADYRSKNPEDVANGPSPVTQEKKKTSRRGGSKLTSNNHTNSTMKQSPNISFTNFLVSLGQFAQNEKLGGSIPQEMVTINSRSVSKSNNAAMMQATAFASPRGQLSTTLAKLLSSNSSVSVPGGIAHSSSDETSSITPPKSDLGNHLTNDSSSLSLASLLASSKGREDGLKAEDEDNAPVCQGCSLNRAQFVCAGCANQWYCSRECQIAAWDDHSELCSG